MNRSHKIKLIVTPSQGSYFMKACGVARFAFNWGLDEWSRQYKNGGDPSALALKKLFNAQKKEQFPWACEVSKYAADTGFRNLDKAFKNFFARRNRYPKFRSKRSVKQSFYAATKETFRVEGKRIRLPVIGWVNMAEELRFLGSTLTATISKEADGWYVAILVETDDRLHRKCDLGAIGVDLGIKNFAVFSTGEKLPALKPLRAVSARITRLQRSLAKKANGGKNREKAKTKLALLHQRTARIRNDVLHKLSANLAANYTAVVVEDLAVKNMARNRHLSRSIMDSGWAEFRRQLSYKLEMTGGKLIVADRFFASSKTCSACGERVESLHLSEREWICDPCGSVHDRDVNAAINLKNLAAGYAVSAFGANGSGVGNSAGVKPFALN